MPEAGLDEWTSWRCGNDNSKFCPPEGCPKRYGCAITHGWRQGMPTPNGCLGLPEHLDGCPSGDFGPCDCPQVTEDAK